MNVLSLFDGLGGCRIALERAGIKPNKYYASEIDKYAIKICNKNYPDTIHLGNILDWHFWDIEWSSIDLVTGGFPCQAWSIAGKQLGDKEDRGILFWYMLDIMQMVLAHNPKAKFLIENVKMKREFEEYITHHTEQALGHIHKILINSALVSAQNRNRYYWTNIQGITQPEDKGLILADVIEDGRALQDKGQTILSTIYKENAKSMVKRNKKGLLVLGNCEPKKYKETSVCHHAADATDIKGNDSIKRVYAETGKAPTLTTMQGGHREPKVTQGYCAYRKLTPLECERLQNLPDGYTDGVSNSQRYKMIGNGWTIDVIAHIFRGLNNDKAKD